MQSVYKEAMRKVINKQAETLYEKLGLTPGFDIADTVHRLGGEIQYVSKLDDGVEARITASQDHQNFIIECVESVQMDDKYTRFAVAHELGHLFLHMIKFQDNTNDYRIVGNYRKEAQSISINEWEAEEFAAAFLMPAMQFRFEVDKIWDNLQIEDKTEYLSNIFKVPYKSIITRGKGLEIWR